MFRTAASVFVRSREIESGKGSSADVIGEGGAVEDRQADATGDLKCGCFVGTTKSMAQAMATIPTYAVGLVATVIANAGHWRKVQ